MKKYIVRIVGLVFVGPTMLAGVAWLNNIIVAVQWNPEDGHEASYYGPVSWLDWSAVDFSTVSTLVPFFGFLLIAAGFFRTSEAKVNSNVSEYFPFFKSYVPVTIALGLIGTVWGLIMIGYYDPKRVDMSDLILCLRTALYSTLVALIWAFLFVHPIRYIMQCWYRYVSDYKNPGTGEGLIPILEAFGSSALTAKQTLSQMRGEFSELNKQVSKTKSEFAETTGIMTELKARANEVFNEPLKLVEQMHSHFAVWQQVAEEQRRVVQKLGKELDKERHSREKAEERAKSAERERDMAETRLHRAKEILKKILKV